MVQRVCSSRPLIEHDTATLRPTRRGRKLVRPRMSASGKVPVGSRRTTHVPGSLAARPPYDDANATAAREAGHDIILHTDGNTVQGRSLASQRLIAQPQINGSESFTKPGWMASHGTG